MWRFRAFHHHVLTHTGHAPQGDFNWAAGIESFRSPILVVAGTCGDAGAEFQRTDNLGALPQARLGVVPGAGHLTLFLDHAAETLTLLRGYLAAYREPAG